MKLLYGYVKTFSINTYPNKLNKSPPCTYVRIYHTNVINQAGNSIDKVLIYYYVCVIYKKK